jgi:integrase
MLPPRPEKKLPTLSPDQIHELIELLEGRNKYFVSLLCLAGLRRSEVFGLKWEDIDFRHRMMAIRRQFTQCRIQPVKTDLSKSTIPMSGDLISYLKAWKLQCGSLEWVFKGKGDKPLSGE